MGTRSSSSQAGLIPIAVLLKRLRRKRLALMQPILENPRQHVLSSIRTLAREIKAQPSTVHRAVQAMGFSTYKDFQRYLHELSVIVATPLDLMEQSDNTNSGLSGHVRQTLDDALKNLQTLRNSLDPPQLERLARHIYRADRILIIGGDLALSLVWFLEYGLQLIGLPVTGATSYGSIMHLTRNAGPRDVVIAISFRRGLRQTIEGLLQARLKKAHCVGITDSVISPIARNSDQHFLASIESSSYGGSYVAPMGLLDAILAACAQYHRKRTLRLLREADRESRSGNCWYAPKSGQA